MKKITRIKINALKQSILQWELMVNSSMNKETAYEKISGTLNFNNCFLCDVLECKHCLSWKISNDKDKNSPQCTEPESPFQKWNLCKEKCEKETQKVLDYLKGELKELIFPRIIQVKK